MSSLPIKMQPLIFKPHNLHHAATPTSSTPVQEHVYVNMPNGNPQNKKTPSKCCDIASKIITGMAISLIPWTFTTVILMITICPHFKTMPAIKTGISVIFGSSAILWCSFGQILSFAFYNKLTR